MTYGTSKYHVIVNIVNSFSVKILFLDLCHLFRLPEALYLLTTVKHIELLDPLNKSQTNKHHSNRQIELLVLKLKTILMCLGRFPFQAQGQLGLVGISAGLQVIQQIPQMVR